MPKKSGSPRKRRIFSTLEISALPTFEKKKVSRKSVKGETEKSYKVDLRVE